MPTRGIVTLVCAAITMSLAGIAPAEAAATGYVASPGAGVLFDDCRDVAVPYALSLDPGTDSWDMTVAAYGPDGTEQVSDYVYSGADSRSGTAYLQFCGYEDAGTYTLRATGETQDFDVSSGGSRRFALPETTFTMRQPHSTTALARVGKRKARTFSASVTDERPNGYFPSAYADVRLQGLKKGSWRDIPGASWWTDSTGRRTFRIGRKVKVTHVRAVTAGDSEFDGSISAPLRLR